MYMYFCENEVQVIWSDPGKKIDWVDMTKVYDAKGSHCGTIWTDRHGEVAGLEILGEHDRPVHSHSLMVTLLSLLPCAHSLMDLATLVSLLRKVEVQSD